MRPSLDKALYEGNFFPDLRYSPGAVALAYQAVTRLNLNGGKWTGQKVLHHALMNETVSELPILALDKELSAEFSQLEVNIIKPQCGANFVEDILVPDDRIRYINKWEL